MSTPYPTPLTGSDQDETTELRPKFGLDGLLAAIAQDSETGEVLMLAWMNEDALTQTIESGLATYWSRSRKALWVKGETSGNLQQILEIRVDCDQDALLLIVQQTGGACHTERHSCFYRSIADDGRSLLQLSESS